MNGTEWLVTSLMLSLPTEYRLERSYSCECALPGPHCQYTREESWAWRAGSETTLTLFEWTPSDPRTCGPMIASAEWPVTVAGQTTKLIETCSFRGRPQRALLTHLQAAESQILVTAVGMPRQEFEGLLAGIVLAPSQQW
jgi:hypothetical protein